MAIASPLAAQGGKLPTPISVLVKPNKAAGTVWSDEGPRTWTPRPTSASITANDLRTRLYQLAADSMQGRAAG